MDAPLQRRVQRYGWDKASGYYEQFWRRQLEPAQQRVLDRAALLPGESVLDVACGSGWLTFRMAESVGPDGTVYGTDISDNMVARCREAATSKMLSNVRFERYDAEELVIDEGMYDVAICSLGLMYVTDAGKAVSGMVRAVRAGGRVIASVWGQRNKCGWADIFPIVEKRVKSDVCPLFFQQGTGNLLQQTFAEAGLVQVVSERLNSPLPYDTEEEACGAAFAGGPVALAYSRFDDQMKKEAEAEYLDSIQRYKQGSGYVVPGEFVIVSGFKS